MKRLMILALLLFAGTASAQEYTYWLTDTQPWSDSATGTTSSSTVQVRSYTPGSNVITYRNMTISVPNYTTGTNGQGDSVGYAHHTYGIPYRAWVSSYDYGRYNVDFPINNNYMGTVLSEVNDNRLAAGFYQTTGASRHAVIYDLVYRTWHEVTPGLFTDINNNGQAVGYYWNYNVGKRAFLYACEGLVDVNVPGATGTVPMNITDAGVISGSVSGLDGGYFVAEPTTPYIPSCALVRDPATLGDPWTPPPPVTAEERECGWDGGFWLEGPEGWDCFDSPDSVPDPEPAEEPEELEEPEEPDTGNTGGSSSSSEKKIAECEEEGGTWIVDNCEE
jgi:probable HAF family extracellular repeat protein